MVFKTVNGSKWDTEKPIRTSMPIYTTGLGKNSGMLTGNSEVHELNGEKAVMVEVKHDDGCDFIFEEYVNQIVNE